jgi:hypothetical protein
MSVLAAPAVPLLTGAMWAALLCTPLLPAPALTEGARALLGGPGDLLLTISGARVTSTANLYMKDGY